MNRHFLRKVDWAILGWAVLLCALAKVLFGGDAFFGTAVGALVALLNWMAFRYIGVRLAATGEKSRFALFLALKTVILMGTVVLILAVTSVMPVAFMVGISTLVLGLFTRSLFWALAEGEKALRED